MQNLHDLQSARQFLGCFITHHEDICRTRALVGVRIEDHIRQAERSSQNLTESLQRISSRYGEDSRLVVCKFPFLATTDLCRTILDKLKFMVSLMKMLA